SHTHRRCFDFLSRAESGAASRAPADDGGKGILMRGHKWNESTFGVRFVCSDPDVGYVCTRSAQPLVRSGIRVFLRAGLDVRLPARRMALRVSGSCVVDCGGTQVVVTPRVGVMNRSLDGAFS